MKKFKALKRMTALALCGIMCLGSTFGVSATSSTVSIYDDEDFEMSDTVLTREGNYFSAETVVKKDYAGRNKYNSSLYMYPMVRDDNTQAYTRHSYSTSKYAGYTGNLLIKKTYSDFTLLFVDGTITTNGKSKSVTY